MYTIDKKHYEILKTEFPYRNNYITFRYMIPFRLPFYGAFHIELDGVVFTFLHRQYQHYGKNDFKFDSELIKHTVVEATFSLTDTKSLNIYEEMRKRPNASDSVTSELFDKQFNILNDYCEILLVMYSLYNIEHLNFNDIVGVPSYTLYKINDENFELKLIGEFKIKNQKTFNEIENKKLTYTEVDTSINNYHTFKENPYYMFAVYGRKGEKAWLEEDFNQSIIFFQTSMEILVQQFIVDCYTKMNWKPINTIKNLQLKKEFTKHVEHHFIKLFERLKLPNRKLLKKLVMDYKNSCFQYRNDIVHEGIHYGRYESRKTKVLVSDITNLLLYDINQAPENDFIIYYKRMFNDTPDIKGISSRYNTKIL